MATQKSDWWFDFFPAFRPILAGMPAKVTNSEVAFIIRKLGLKPGMSFLDCPCGIGRISIPLAKKRNKGNRSGYYWGISR